MQPTLYYFLYCLTKYKTLPLVAMLPPRGGVNKRWRNAYGLIN